MTIDNKLHRGHALLRRAGDDEATLGLAMITLHGALEDHIDEMLRRDPALDPQVRAEIDADRLGWLSRADAALARGLLTPTQRNIALEANRLRQAVAHGEPFAGSAASVEQYAAFVAEVTGRAAAPRAAHAATEAATAAHAVPEDTAWNARASKNTARRTATRPRPRPPGARPVLTLPVRNMALTAAAVFGALAILWWMWTGIFGATPPQPQVASQRPTIAVLPTPVPQQASIARLGGATGFLRTTPSFNAPTYPAQVRDGTRVVLLNRPSVTAEGTTWRYVEYSGYQGWVPENNLDVAAVGVG